MVRSETRPSGADLTLLRVRRGDLGLDESLGDCSRANGLLEIAPRSRVLDPGVVRTGHAPHRRLEIQALARWPGQLGRIEALSFLPDVQRDRGEFARERDRRQLLAHPACHHAVVPVLQWARLTLGRRGRARERLLRDRMVIAIEPPRQRGAPPAPEDLYEIVNERYERGSLIVTSNRAFSEWPDLFQSPLLASAALDRLAHHAHQLVITGDSYRAKGKRRGLTAAAEAETAA